MARRKQIFVSYAREDRSAAARLAELLEDRGVSVWWDSNLISGQDYRSEIRRQIEEADRVLVLWSEQSVASHFVLDECALAKEQAKLVPLRLDNVDLPLGFGGLHTIDVDTMDRSIDQIHAAILDKSHTTVPQHRPDRRKFVLWGSTAAAVSAAGFGLYELGRGRWSSAEAPQAASRKQRQPGAAQNCFGDWQFGL